MEVAAHRAGGRAWKALRKGVKKEEASEESEVRQGPRRGLCLWIKIAVVTGDLNKNDF